MTREPGSHHARPPTAYWRDSLTSVSDLCRSRDDSRRGRGGRPAAKPARSLPRALCRPGRSRGGRGIRRRRSCPPRPPDEGLRCRLSRRGNRLRRRRAADKQRLRCGRTRRSSGHAAERQARTCAGAVCQRHHRGGARHRVARCGVLLLRVRGARATRGRWHTDGRHQLTGCECGREDAAEEVVRRNFPLATGTCHEDRRAERGQDGRVVGAGSA